MADIPLRYNAGNLQEMTDAQIDYSAHRILESFASSNSGTGTVNINGAGTAIGTFVDTERPNTIGSHPVGTNVNSVTLTFNQELTAVAENITRPLVYNTGNLNQADDTAINGTVINRALTELVNDGLGSYAVQPSAPSGGTWVAISTITDQAQGGDTITTLWRKTAATAPATFRPLKVRNDNDIQEMTDAEIQTLTTRFRNQIVSTGVGQYRVQQNAPGTGTWVRKGLAWTDTRQQVANQAYAGAYSGAYAGAYAGYFTRFYAGVNYGSFTGYFTGYYTGFYTGYYTGLTVQGTKETVSTASLWIRTA